MTHFDFGVKCQGHSDLEMVTAKTINYHPNNVSQGPGKGAYVSFDISCFDLTFV